MTMYPRRSTVVLSLAALMVHGAARRVFCAGHAGGSSHAGSCDRAGRRRAAGDGQAVLCGLPQRPHQDGGGELRRPDGAEHRAEPRPVREGGAEAARPRDAAARREAARARRRGFAGDVARDLARWRRQPGLSPRQDRPAPAQSQGIRERGSRPAERRDRRRRAAAGRRRRRRLRQHRVGAAGVAVVHRAVRDRGALGRGESHWPGRRAARRLDVPRRARHAADARGRPAARHPRRHPRQRRSAVGRRVRRGHRRHRDEYLGQRDGVREPAGRDPRRQSGLRDGHWRRRGHEAVRSGAERRPGQAQRPPEEHPLHHHRRPAPGGRGVPAPHLRRIR